MKKDVVYEIVGRMLNNSPERSYKRLNPALRSTLANCIEADLPFQENTFQRIYKHLRGSFWFGDGAGSHIGENLYTLACSLGHASAQQSFEAFADRPACPWEEQVRTPFRLHVGARFTWKGHRVTVTSMSKDKLVACTYKGYQNRAEGLSVGASFYAGKRFTIQASRNNGTNHTLCVIQSTEDDSRIIDRRFIIPYAEITALRRTAKARVKAITDRIYASDPSNATELDSISKAINSEHFRHFELEEINAAFQKHRKEFASREKVAAWRKGAGGSWIGSDSIHLRVKDNRVECSNGNSIKKATAVSILPVILAQRNASSAINLPIDSYTIERVDKTGAQVGCTLVPWTEIEYVARELKIAI